MSKANGRQTAKLVAIRLAPTVSPYTRFRPGLIHTPMIDVAQSRFDMLLVEGFTPSPPVQVRGCRRASRPWRG